MPLVLLGIDDAQRPLVVALDEVSHYGTARFVDIVGATHNDDALGIQ